MNPFPSLTTGSYIVTSPSTPSYNCIAWAAGEDFRWWWPTPGIYYWPPSAPFEETIDAFSAAFASLGYEPCGHGEPEDGWIKVAIYASSAGVPTHMARLLSNGMWTSKLGADVDLSHLSPQVIEGPAYGSVVRFLKKAVTA